MIKYKKLIDLISKNFINILNRFIALFKAMPVKTFILAYDIHTPSEHDSEEEWILETQKRRRMRLFLNDKNADEVCKSTYVVSIDTSAKNLYETIMQDVIVEERDNDCIYVAELVEPVMHTRALRNRDRMKELAGIKS